MLSEVANTNSLVFESTGARTHDLRTRGEHANHENTDVLIDNYKQVIIQKN
jgi:hypothetical protein